MEKPLTEEEQAAIRAKLDVLKARVQDVSDPIATMKALGEAFEWATATIEDLGAEVRRLRALLKPGPDPGVTISFDETLGEKDDAALASMGLRRVASVTGTLRWDPEPPPPPSLFLLSMGLDARPSRYRCGVCGHEFDGPPAIRQETGAALALELGIQNHTSYIVTAPDCPRCAPPATTQ